MNFERLLSCLVSDITFWLPISPTPDPARYIWLPQKQHFDVGARSDLHWPWVVEHSGPHENWVVAAPGQSVQGQTRIIY